jgi:hypothetical protein
MQAGTVDHMSGVNASAPDRLVVTLAHPDCEFYLRTKPPNEPPTTLPHTTGPEPVTSRWASHALGRRW